MTLSDKHGQAASAAPLCARHSADLKAALLTAVIAAGTCMFLAVPIGMLTELFLKPPAPAAVSTWTEYTSSHWTDPCAFANTLDSAFTHLLIAPIVAGIFGAIGAFIANAIPHRSRARASQKPVNPSRLWKTP